MADTDPKTTPAPERRDVRDLPHYKLATLAGEQTEDRIDEELHAKNRALWNQWATQDLTDEERQAYIDDGTLLAEDVQDRDPDKLQKAARQRGLNDIPSPKAPIDFSNTDWPDLPTSFNGFIFPAVATFTRANLTNIVTFDDATFTEIAFFLKTNFRSLALFKKTKFKDFAPFGQARFKSVADFTDLVIEKHLDFEGVQCDSHTYFTNAIFNVSVPEFFETRLHEATFFHGVIWPAPARDNPVAAQRQADAYSCLKRKMAELNRHEAELDFFARELSALSHCQPRSRAWAIRLYGWVSDYGRSVVRPLICGVLVWYFGALGYLLVVEPTAKATVGFSAASMASVLGARREIFPDTMEHASLPVALLSTGQGIIGAGLLFLIGLALRNRFRIR